MHFNTKTIVFIIAGIFIVNANVFAKAENNVEWANQQLGELPIMEQKADFAKAKAFAETLKAKKNLNDVSTIRWAERSIMKKHKIKIKLSQHIKTKNGIDINQLIKRYSNHMPTAEKLMHGKFHDLLIFVSFSMPKQSLKLWLQQAKEANGVLVIRGLVNNSFRKTANAVRQLIGHRQGGLEVDPTLYRRFEIHKVPAVVVINGTAPPCFDPKGCPLVAPPFDVVYGNTSLQSALKMIVNRGTVSRKKAKKILMRMRIMS